MDTNTYTIIDIIDKADIVDKKDGIEIIKITRSLYINGGNPNALYKVELSVIYDINVEPTINNINVKFMKCVNNEYAQYDISTNEDGIYSDEMTETLKSMFLDGVLETMKIPEPMKFSDIDLFNLNKNENMNTIEHKEKEQCDLVLGDVSFSKTLNFDCDKTNVHYKVKLDVTFKRNKDLTIDMVKSEILKCVDGKYVKIEKFPEETLKRLKEKFIQNIENEMNDTLAYAFSIQTDAND